MKLVLSDNSSVAIDIKENSVWNDLAKGYKHLQHVPIQFYPWDDELHFDKSNTSKLVKCLAEHAKKLDIDIDLLLCNKRDRYYLNKLHEIYEKNYDGKRDWLVFHEHIHMLEVYTQSTKNNNTDTQLHIQWRDLAGLLTKDFKYEYLKESSTSVEKGDVYVRWQELGKVPYRYWTDNEPDDITRINELCTPWKTLYHDFSIALEDKNFLQIDYLDKNAFTIWWDQYHDCFCEHNNIPQWNIRDMCSIIKFGKIPNVDELVSKLDQSIVPHRIQIG